MLISLIAAMDETRRIGLQNRLPWHQSADQQRFKALTLGHHLILGHTTYASIGRPLPGRISIILTHDPTFQAPECLVARTLDEALALTRSRGETEVFVIGGEQVFTQALPLADRLYLTILHTRGPGDAYFPAFDPDDWRERSTCSYPADEKNEYPYTFQDLERI